MKLVIILTLTRYLSSYKYEEKGLKSVAVIFALVFLPLFLIIQQPDLGTALIFIPLLFVTLYVWSGRLKHIVVTLLAGAALSPFLWYFLKDYQKERLLVFLNPNIDPLGAGYTIIQSKIAIGSGGILGKGWLHGSQTQLNFLPEHHTDFIFSSIAEETGLIGALVVIVLYFLIIWEGFNIAQDSSIMEKKLIASGITTLLALHVIINICMTLGLMPVVGLPLPFISYGGSHTVMFLIMVAILLNLKYR
jgi:rod shape determining protein RodA